MSSTNHTPNIGLSQFLGTDKPTWLGNYNSDMEKIDTAVHNLQVTTTSTIAGNIQIIEQSVRDLIENDTNQNINIAANTSSISMLQMDIVKNKQDISNLDIREQRHYDALSGSINSSDTEISDIKENITYIIKNIDKIEASEIINTASISKLQVRMHNAEINIDNLQNQQVSNSDDIANLQTDVDSLEVQNREQDTDIRNAKRNIAANTSSIAAIAIRLDNTTSYSNARLNMLETNTAALRQDLDNNTTVIAGAVQNVTALQTKTENISDGVSVPFGFGTTAENRRGYENSDGTIEAFITDADLSEVKENVNTNNNDITTLVERTENITPGKALPFSLGIAEGGAYGYIENGETGVTPFVRQADIDQIVTIGEKTANIQGSPVISANVAKNANMQNSYTLSANGNNPVTLSASESNTTFDISVANRKIMHAEEAESVNTASISKLQVRMHSAENNIDNLQTQQGTNRNNIDSLQNQQNTNTTDIENLKNSVKSQNSNISALRRSVTALETKNVTIERDVDTLKNQDQSTLQDLGNLQRTVSTHGNTLSSVSADVGTVKQKTRNISDGVTVPFSFGVDSSGNYGYKKAGADTVYPFLNKGPLTIHNVILNITARDSAEGYVLPAGNYSIIPYTFAGTRGNFALVVRNTNDTLHSDINIHGDFTITENLIALSLLAVTQGYYRIVHGFLVNKSNNNYYPI